MSYEVFICYPRSLEDRVTILHDMLEKELTVLYKRDSKVFQDKSDLEGGMVWRETIDQAIENARIMIVVVVPVIGESPECLREIRKFLEVKKKNKHIIPLEYAESAFLKETGGKVAGELPTGSEEAIQAELRTLLCKWQIEDFKAFYNLDRGDTEYADAVAKLAHDIAKRLKPQNKQPDEDETPTTGGPAPPPGGDVKNPTKPLKTISLVVVLAALLLTSAVWFGLPCRFTPLQNTAGFCKVSKWEKLSDTAKFGVGGSFFAEPDRTSARLGDVTTDAKIVAPIWVSEDHPDWSRVEVGGTFHYTPSSNLRDPREWQELPESVLVGVGGSFHIAPDDEASQIEAVKPDQIYTGKFRNNPDYAGWLRFGDDERFTRTANLRPSEPWQKAEPAMWIGVGGATYDAPDATATLVDSIQPGRAYDIEVWHNDDWPEWVGLGESGSLQFAKVDSIRQARPWLETEENITQVRSGVFYGRPDATSTALGTLRPGEPITGPFYENDDFSDWYRFRRGGLDVYAKSELFAD